MKELLTCLWQDASMFVKVRVAWVLALVVAASVLGALGPVALKVVVDALVKGPAGVHPGGVAVLVALYVACQWLARSAGELRGLIFARAERRVLRSASERLFGHLMRLPMRFHLERRTGAISQVLDNGLQGYQLILHHVIFTLIPAVAELATIVTVLLHLTQPIFLALFCGALLAYSAAFAFAVSSVSRLAERASSSSIDSTAAMVDALLCVETVKCFAAEPIAEQRVSRSLACCESRWVEFYRCYSLNGLGVAGIFALFLAATMGYAAREVYSGSMTVGGFVLVGTYMLQVATPVEMLGSAVQGLSQGMAMLRRMLEVFREAPELQLDRAGAPVVAPGQRTQAARARGDIEFRNVSVSYGRDRKILDNVSFRVPPGATLAIVGASGCGKSTIARLLVRLLEADAGKVMLDGVWIGYWPLEMLRGLIAVVPQDTVLFNDTIACNIALGKQDASIAEIERAARRAHLHEFIEALPDRYETQVGERGLKLSGGERQRISIARAALRCPRIYVLDEATSSLDSCSERDILRDLAELSRQCTTIMIAHRLSTIIHADEIVLLERGSIVERGSHAQLVCQGGRYAALWGAQQHGSQAA